MQECEKFCRPLEIDCNMLHINSNMKHTQKNTSKKKKKILTKKKNLGRPQKLRGGSILQIYVCNLKDETCLANAWQVQDLSEGKVTWGTALRYFNYWTPMNQEHCTAVPDKAAMFAHAHSCAHGMMAMVVTQSLPCTSRSP